MRARSWQLVWLLPILAPAAPVPGRMHSDAYALAADQGPPAGHQAQGVGADGSPCRPGADQFSYLEDSHSPLAVAWVRAQSDHTLARFEGLPAFAANLKIAAANAGTEGELGAAGYSLQMNRGWIYEVRRGASGKGVWRRTSAATYFAGHPKWQVLINLDREPKEQGRNWYLVLARFAPDTERALLLFSDGLSDVHEWREFDLKTRAFIRGGLAVEPATGSDARWLGDDAILFSHSPGGAELKGAGGVVSLLRRGEGAPTVLIRADPGDFGASVADFPYTSAVEPLPRGDDATAVIVTRAADLAGRYWRVASDGRLAHLTFPPRLAYLVSRNGWYFFETGQSWSVSGVTIPSGALVAIRHGEALRPNPSVHVLWKPDGENSLSTITATRSGLVVLGSRLGSSFFLSFRSTNGAWRSRPMGLPPHGHAFPVMSDGDAVYALYENFTIAPTLFRLSPKTSSAYPVRADPGSAAPGRFVTEQREAVSSDGAKVPYYLVYRRGLRLNGRSPVLLKGYGAYGTSSEPHFSADLLDLWLKRGWVYALAGVRGGRERGDKWYVRGTDRRLTYDDMTAVAEDLVRSRVTSPQRLAVIGASAGGLLAGVMLTGHPQLFHAAVIEVPVLDNFRVDLLSGTPASRYAQYGDPRTPNGCAFLLRTSPFQNLSRERKLPPPLIISSTNDTNVFPYQARRFAAKMQALGMPVYYAEFSEGGHGAALPGEQQARLDALIYTYLQSRIAN